MLSLVLRVIVIKLSSARIDQQLEILSEKNFNAQTVQSHLNLVTGLVAHNKNTFQLLQSSVANFGELKFGVSLDLFSVVLAHSLIFVGRYKAKTLGTN